MNERELIIEAIEEARNDWDFETEERLLVRLNELDFEEETK